MIRRMPIRTWEVRRDGVGEVGVPDVAVALPQLHLLDHGLRLPRHPAAARSNCVAPRPASLRRRALRRAATRYR
jgi:hypothetical protein